MIYQICDAMSIIIVDRVHFWIYLLNHNSLTHQAWSIDRYKHRQYFVWKTGAKFQVLFSFVTCSNYSITNYLKFPVFQFFELLNSFFSTTKHWQISLYCHFIKIIKGPGASFQSPALSQKHVRNICHTPH